MVQMAQARLAHNRERLRHLHHRITGALREQAQRRHTRLDRLHARLLALHPITRLVLLAPRLAEQQQRLHRAMALALERKQTSIRHAARALQAVSPLATLDRGYAILFDASGRVLRSVGAADHGDRLTARLADGELQLQVTDD
jgi:exodeoxyribonuclease VII large subunit